MSKERIATVGNIFGDLKVLSLSTKKDKYKNLYYNCMCSCGSVSIVRGSHLRSGSIKSCGCKSAVKIKHNKTGTPEHTAWLSMIQRCSNPNNKRYEHYGLRGIKVCNEWSCSLEGFTNFLRDLGERPSEDYTLERLNVNEDYTPDNCVWIEKNKQSRNRRRHKNNMSGVTGVYFHKQGKWVATWNEYPTNKPKSKSFSVNKYGYEESFILACEARREAIKIQNKLGAGYSNNHGE